MPKITAHAMLRYAERIKHFRVKDHNIKNIDKKTQDRYSRELEKVYRFSKLIYSGVFRDYKKSHFRIANDIILILDTHEKCIITLFRVDFGLLGKENRDIKKSILKELETEHSRIMNIESAMKDEGTHSILKCEHQRHMKKYSKLAETICYSVDFRVKQKQVYKIN